MAIGIHADIPCTLSKPLFMDFAAGSGKAVHAGVWGMLTLHWGIMTRPCTLLRNTWRSARRYMNEMFKILPQQIKILYSSKANLPLCVCFVFSKTGDRSGELTARMNVSDLQTVLGLSYSTNNSTLSENKDIDYNLHGKKHTHTTSTLTLTCM